MKVKKSKPKACPRCKSKTVLPIIYGYPSLELAKEEEQGKVVLGGCCVSADGTDPKWQCADCNNQWR